MEVGFHIVSFDWPDQPRSIAPTLARIGDAAEAVGASDLTLMDHWFQMENFAPASDPMMEGYTTLGYLAAATATVRLGLLVTGVTYRRPGLLAKIVATLDVLSAGRAQLGIGAAWYEREHAGLGVPFPPVAERFELLDETLRICEQMWSDDDRTIRRQALPARRDAVRAAPDLATSAAHPHRRRRGEEDAAARGSPRRCVQPVRVVSRRRRPQARRSASPLRR